MLWIVSWRISGRSQDVVLHLAKSQPQRTETKVGYILSHRSIRSPDVQCNTCSSFKCRVLATPNWWQICDALAVSSWLGLFQWSQFILVEKLELYWKFFSKLIKQCLIQKLLKSKGGGHSTIPIYSVWNAKWFFVLTLYLPFPFCVNWFILFFPRPNMRSDNLVLSVFCYHNDYLNSPTPHCI